MIKEKKNLKKLTTYEMQAVSGGKIYCAFLDGPTADKVYFVAVPHERQVYRCLSHDEAHDCAHAHNMRANMRLCDSPRGSS